ncbi:YwiC-like family protein [Thermopolyspora sp. NPDC052614]|uniref:YwiC-like family protein n=1 Tax=Thermopolyspora sp. NPDC052614 TaxID=3155682 RepID=UPI00344129A8
MTISRPAPANPTATPSGRRRRGRWIPPQHGAWAMLLVPYLAGLLTTGFTWVQLPLLIAWLGGYLLSYFALLAVKTRRVSRFRPQLLTYGLVALATGTVVLAARPQLIAFAPLFIAVLAINGFFASRHDDRALINGLVSTAAASLILPVVAVVNGESPWQTAQTTLIIVLYFAGTVFFVKSCIRERGNRPLLTTSIAFHTLTLAAATWLAPPYALPFTCCLARAALLPRLAMSAKQIGMAEVAGSLLLLAMIAVVE